MTVIIEKPAINLREELADLRNQETYQEQQFYFDGLVTNGTFDSGSTGYTEVLNGTISYAANTMAATATTGNTGVYQDVPVIANVAYSVSWDQVSGTNLRINVYNGANFITSLFNNGTGNADVGSKFATVIPTTTTIRIYAHTSTGNTAEFDNISVFEVDANDDVIHTMPKGWVPKDVFEDGLLQREGAANDYTVVYDGFDYYVKPAVAPSATTQTCVIGVRK